MPPRYAYWTILIDNAPTAFRAASREDLLPTLHQLRRKNADVVMKWFARGRLWDSPEAAQAAAREKTFREKRGRDWRPGGDHKDPRARFDKNARKQHEREGRPDRTHGDARHAQPPAAPPGERRPSGERPWRPKIGGAQRPWKPKPDGSQRPWKPKPGGPQRPWKPKPGGPQRPWKPKPSGPPRPWTPKPDGPQRPWKSKPGGPQRPWKPKGDDRRWHPKGGGAQPNADQPPRRRRDEDENKPKEPKRG